jgi:tripartite-type tricarboxylate transporter receptor subunit TctC
MNGGLEPNPGSPEELSRYIQQEATKWRKIVHQSGAKEQ